MQRDVVVVGGAGCNGREGVADTAEGDAGADHSTDAQSPDHVVGTIATTATCSPLAPRELAFLVVVADFLMSDADIRGGTTDGGPEGQATRMRAKPCSMGVVLPVLRMRL